MITDKVRPHHLERKALLYVRQSSAHQVLHNRESSALQYVRGASHLAVCGSMTLLRTRFSPWSSPAPLRRLSLPRKKQTNGGIKCAKPSSAISKRHAMLRIDAADPANRLVAGELETRWNKALARVAEVEGKIAAHDTATVAPVADPARSRPILGSSGLPQQRMHD